LKNKENKSFIEKYNSIKIIATKKNDKVENFDAVLQLPTSIDEINFIVENLSAKKIFNKNSSIKIKEYFLDKNEKKLIKENNFVILTEKEIQLLELLLNCKMPIARKQILSTVWQYASDADTHTVETHIYRLRKKINNKFSDEKFILNNKEGYYL
jgi:DNA-binding response OmpR family regulator